MTTTDNELINATQNWVSSVVVGLNFCPFARRELANTRYLVCRHTQIVRAIDALLDECAILDRQPEFATSLIIYPAFVTFEHYNQLLNEGNLALERCGLLGVYQLASFHPEYLFEGEPDNSPSHYTNRAPYPILHLLRESAVEQALKSYRDPESIPARNIARTQVLGNEELARMLDSCFSHGHKPT